MRELLCLRSKRIGKMKTFSVISVVMKRFLMDFNLETFLQYLLRRSWKLKPKKEQDIIDSPSIQKKKKKISKLKSLPEEAC